MFRIFMCLKLLGFLVTSFRSLSLSGGAISLFSCGDELR